MYVCVCIPSRGQKGHFYTGSFLWIWSPLKELIYIPIMYILDGTEAVCETLV